MIFFEYFRDQPWVLSRDNPKLGVTWWRHSKRWKYKAFTTRLYTPWAALDINIVWKNIAEYKRVYDK